MKLNIKPQTLVVLLAVVITIGLVYFLAWPLAGEVKLKTEQLGTKKAEAAALEQRRDELRDFTDQLPNYQADIDRLVIAYPNEPQIAEALIQAETMAGRSGLTILSLAPGRANDKELPINFVIKGSYQSLAGFLQELNFNLRPVVVHSVQMAPAGEKEPGVIKATVQTGFAFQGLAAAPSTTSKVSPAPATTKLKAADKEP